MNTNKLNIPKKIKVGYQNRQGTYTGKLAYIIYFDSKGVLRKEKSWQSWRDSSIPFEEFDNIPTEGFVLNKGVGGQRQSYGWNARNEYIRVYDPRNFEFEISVANLLFILKECDCNKGKGLEGKFVYSWDKTELVLLPISSEDYKLSNNYSNLQTKSVHSKDLIKGATYLSKNLDELIYLGKLPKYNNSNSDNYKSKIYPFMNHVFWDKKHFVFLKDLKIATCINEDCCTNYADLIDSYNKSIYGNKIKKLFLKTKKLKGKKNRYDINYWAVEISTDVFHIYRDNNYYYNKNSFYTLHSVVKLDDKQNLQINTPKESKIAFESESEKQSYYNYSNYNYSNNYYNYNKSLVYSTQSGVIPQTNYCLYALLDNGEEYEVGHTGLINK